MCSDILTDRERRRMRKRIGTREKSKDRWIVYRAPCGFTKPETTFSEVAAPVRLLPARAGR